jgi:hypothetical protein
MLYHFHNNSRGFSKGLNIMMLMQQFHTKNPLHENEKEENVWKKNLRTKIRD